MTRQEFFDQYALTHGYEEAKDALEVRDELFPQPNTYGVTITPLYNTNHITSSGTMQGTTPDGVVIK